MPALPSPGLVVRLNMHFSMSGSPNAMNRLYFRYTGTFPSSAQLAAFADAAVDAWGGVLSPLQFLSVQTGPFSAQDLASSVGAFGEGTRSHPGSRGGHAVPAGACLNVRFLINRHYRGGKPKAFLQLGTAEDMPTQATWGTGLTTPAASAWTAFINAVEGSVWSGGGTLQHVNVSYYQGFHVVTDPISGRARNVANVRSSPVVDTVAGYSVDNQVGSQRRRNLNT